MYATTFGPWVKWPTISLELRPWISFDGKRRGEEGRGRERRGETYRQPLLIDRRCQPVEPPCMQPLHEQAPLHAIAHQRPLVTIPGGAAGCCTSSACSDRRPDSTWFSRSWLSKSEDKVPIVLLLKYYTYNRGATAQTLSAGGPGLIAPGGTPGKIKWPELGVTELRFRDRLDPADSD